MARRTTDHRPSPDHDVERAWLIEVVRNRFLVVPGLFVVGAVVLALALERFDSAIDIDASFVIDGGPDTASSVLTTIAASIMTMTSLVLSVTVVALQLASQQFSPRVLRTFFRDTGTKISLGIFLRARSLFALFVLRTIDGSAAAEDCRTSRSPWRSPWSCCRWRRSCSTSITWCAIRAVSIIDAVAAETRASIRRLLASEAACRPISTCPDARPTCVLESRLPPGAVTIYDIDDLVQVARRHGCVLRLVPAIGDFVPSGAPLAEVWSLDGGAPTVSADDVVPAVGIDAERTMALDPEFGFRQLVDIAEKALSPAVNDPTTATQSLDRIHDLLRRIAPHPLPTGRHVDGDGTLRLIVPPLTWDGLVHLACDEIRRYGGDAIQIQVKMRVMLADLLTIAPVERQPALEHQQRLLDAALDEHFPNPDDRTWLPTPG